MDDLRFMKRALALAVRARGRTSPNPMVGAVVVKGGRIIAEGYHRRAGTPHAEAIAVEEAGRRARGSTLYVNLEPCCHTKKRTPPCTGVIIGAGIKRVVVAMVDPNPMVSGRGILELRKAGIDVDVGIMEDRARRLNEAYVKYITTKRPFVILKLAQSMDGRIATSRGESKWITGEKARQMVHRLRNEVDAVMVGIGTILKDNPSLDCRIKGGRNPYRVILDTRLSIPPDSRVLKHGDGKTIVVTTRGTQKRIREIKATGSRVMIVRGKGGGVDIGALMDELGRMGIMSVMIEGGSSVGASALSEGVVDKVMFFIAPIIIGGVDAIPSIGGRSPLSLKDAIQIRQMRLRRVGGDILLEGYIRDQMSTALL
jgi:diaminohydroxyphosphoribosylaminopyrimidine deaminase/5-amino-6-(5-phosphoribosylamino)uracil reductase